MSDKIEGTQGIELARLKADQQSLVDNYRKLEENFQKVKEAIHQYTEALAEAQAAKSKLEIQMGSQRGAIEYSNMLIGALEPKQDEPVHEMVPAGGQPAPAAPVPARKRPRR